MAQTKFKQYKRLTEKIYKVPNSITDTISINRISEKGIFELEAGSSVIKLYDRAYLFEDINYHTRDEDEKEEIDKKFEQLLNSLNVSFKIIISTVVKNVKKLLTVKKNSDNIVKHVTKDVSRRGVRVVYGAGLENRCG